LHEEKNISYLISQKAAPRVSEYHIPGTCEEPNDTETNAVAFLVKKCREENLRQEELIYFEKIRK